MLQIICKYVLQFSPVSSRLIEMLRKEPTDLRHSVTGASVCASDPRTAARGETEEGRLQSYPHRVRTHPLRDPDG